MRARLVGLLVAVAARLPLRSVQGLGRALGLLLWWCRGRMALVTLRNMAIAYPQMSRREQAALARSSLMETGATIAETLRLWGRPHAGNLGEIVTVDGEAVVAEATARGPVVFVIPHLGNWELLNHFLGERYQLTHMYQVGTDADLDRFILERRARSGTRFVRADRSGIGRQLDVLREGGAIGAMPDQEPAVHTGHFAEFFGEQALTGTLVPQLVTRTGATAVVCWCERLDRGAGFAVRFAPLSSTPADSEPARTLCATAINHAIERAVSAVPEQYLWSYKRFRTRPHGEAELYEHLVNPALRWLQGVLLAGWFAVTAHLGERAAQHGGALLARCGGIVGRRHVRAARVNLSLCYPMLSNRERETLLAATLRTSCGHLLLTARHWRITPPPLPADFDAAGCVILIPPLGARELMIRSLAERHSVTEYYHPDHNAALDDHIRAHRAKAGVRLVPHDDRGRDELVAALARQEAVTMCPDQQPRLRGGLFVPFFGTVGLTTTALADVLRRAGARCAIARCLPDGTEHWHTMIDEIFFDADDDTAMLTAINRALEICIEQSRDQYRWTDKRFNIRPPGSPRVYR